MTLEQLVPSLDLCQQLEGAGFPQDTALRWSMQHVPHIPDVEPTWMPVAFNEPILCAAPTAGELMDMIRAKHPDAEIISRCTWPGAAWVIHFGENGYKNVYGDTSIAALAALVLEVAG